MSPRGFCRHLLAMMQLAATGMVMMGIPCSTWVTINRTLIQRKWIGKKNIWLIRGPGFPQKMKGWIIWGSNTNCLLHEHSFKVATQTVLSSLGFGTKYICGLLRPPHQCEIPAPREPFPGCCKKKLDHDLVEDPIFRVSITYYHQ